MSRLHSIRHEFVEFIPERLEPGVVYISIPYATTAHLCFCGCGSETVNPLAPHGWKLTFDGETISLSPSVGNWSFDCRSHYWIRNDRVEWAGSWSADQVEAGRRARRRHIDHATTPEPVGPRSNVAASPGLLARVRARFSRRKSQGRS